MGGVPVHVEVLMGTRLARAMFAIGIVFDRFSIGTLAKKLTGLDTPFLDALGVDFKVGCDFISSSAVVGSLPPNPKAWSGKRLNICVTFFPAKGHATFHSARSTKESQHAWTALTLSLPSSKSALSELVQ